ncbi:MAG: CRTAC1 family protein [Acidobacteriota bacterium]|nr:MAG: CRTAC1 family protein [Acidobacteriota bacterium]
MSRLGRTLLVLAGLLGLFAVGTDCDLAEVIFEDVTAAAFPDGLINGHYLWGDCDDDGDDDLLVGGKTIFLNNGPPSFDFTKLTDTGELAGGVHQRGLWVDIDNDGDLDIFGIGTESRERLYLNDGSCRFTDISDFDGDGTPDDMGDGAPSMTTTAGDYDADGFLDLYVGNYERYCGGDPLICGDCLTDRLWHNAGNNTYVDVTSASGIYDQEHALAGYCYIAGTPCDTDADCAPWPADSCKAGTCARGSNWVDYDNDGDIDIFVSNYRLDQNLLWENNGDGSFTNVGEARNVDGDEDSGSWGHVLGSDWGDFDNDGDMDLFTANLAHGIYVVLLGHDISQMLENGGPPDFSFTDIRDGSGMRPYDPGAQPDWAETCPAWADYDNDGDLDIYISHIYTSSTHNYSDLYSNNDDKTFTQETPNHPSLKLYKNYSAAWSDYDQDGDLDLVTYGAYTPEGTSEPHLFRNDGGNAGEWLEIEAVGAAIAPGTGSNRSGVGVRITALLGSRSQMREVQGGHGYHTAMNSGVQHFGFGSPGAQHVDQLRVRWTTGSEETFVHVPFRVRYSVFEGITIRRGTIPQSLPELAGGLIPYHDPVLDDGQTYFYSLEGANRSLLVSKDSDRGYVVLELEYLTGN